MTCHRAQLVCLFFVCVMGAPRLAGGDTSREDKPLSPYFFVKSEDAATDALPLKSNVAAVSISGIIAEVTLRQTYENAGNIPVEATYVFPASTRSAVNAMKMTIGKRVIEAEIKERVKARQLYEQARKAGKAGALLEQQRPNVFQMHVANIMPGDKIDVELSYTERLQPTEREYEFVLPTVVGPRYGTTPAAGAPSRERWVENPYLHAKETAPFDFRLTLNLSSGIPLSKVKSPSHNVDVAFDGKNAAHLSLEGADQANRDFVLRYGLLGDQIETGLLTFEGKDENFFLMMIEPPERIAPEQTVAREHIFVVDVSGSMNGFPLDVSKTLMKRILSDLTSRDYFNVMLFAGGSRILSESSLSATQSNIDRAAQWIEAAASGGGTELLPALERALGLPRHPGTSRIVTVITDGYVTVEKEAYELVRQNLGKANLFAFGIGRSVNRELIEILARAGNGEPIVVLNQNESHAAARNFERYVAAPVLQGISVSFDGFNAYDVSPKKVADLFSHRPVAVFGKYRGKPKGHISIAGTSSRGAFNMHIAAADSVPTNTNRPLRHLWARDRIRSLSDLDILGRGTSHKQRITRLGLKYHLMTPYTSFVAVDKVIRNRGGRTVTVRQPSPMPAGVPDSAVGGGELNDLLGGLGGAHYGIMGAGRAAAPKASRSISSSSRWGVGYGRGAGGLGARRGAPPRIRTGSATVTGGLAKAVVRRAIHRHLAAMRSCYERQLRKHPQLSGQVVVELVISGTGKVMRATLKRSSLKNAAFEACIVNTFKRMTFPAPQGGGAVVVRYPLSFSPSK